MNKRINTGWDRSGPYCTVKNAHLVQILHTFSDINPSYAHTGPGLPHFAMWSWALLLMGRAVELIYYFWLLLLTWLKSNWLQPAGNVSTLKGTVSHLYSHTVAPFQSFSIKFPIQQFRSVWKTIAFRDSVFGIRISFVFERRTFSISLFSVLFLPVFHLLFHFTLQHTEPPNAKQNAKCT